MLADITFLDLLKMVYDDTQPSEVTINKNVYKWFPMRKDYYNVATGYTLGTEIQKVIPFEVTSLVSKKIINYDREVLTNSEKDYLSDLLYPYIDIVDYVEKIPIEQKEKADYRLVITFNDGMTIAKFEEINGSTKFGNDTIISTVTVANPDNTDVINITGSSLYNNNLTYAKNGNDLVISTRHTTNYYTEPVVWATDSTITYQNFFDTNTLHNNLKVKDNDNIYDIESYDTATTVDWASLSTNARVAFLTASEGTNIVNTGGYSYTNVVISDGGATLTLNYNPDGDSENKVKVDSMSATANDIYNVNMTGSNPYLYIKDAGGNDTLNFNTSTDVSIQSRSKVKPKTSKSTTL